MLLFYCSIRSSQYTIKFHPIRAKLIARSLSEDSLIEKAVLLQDVLLTASLSLTSMPMLIPHPGSPANAGWLTSSPGYVRTQSRPSPGVVAFADSTPLPPPPAVLCPEGFPCSQRLPGRRSVSGPLSSPTKSHITAMVGTDRKGLNPALTGVSQPNPIERGERAKSAPLQITLETSPCCAGVFGRTHPAGWRGE